MAVRQAGDCQSCRLPVMTAWHDARMSQPQTCFVLRAPTNSGQYDRFYSNYVYGVTYKHRSEQRGAEIRRNFTETR